MLQPIRYQRKSEREILFVGISIALHLLLLLALRRPEQIGRYETQETRVALLSEAEVKKLSRSDVDSSHAPTPQVSLPKEQIVATPDLPSQTPTVPTRFRSDRDTRAVKEQIRRGTEPTRVSQKQSRAPESQERSASTKETSTSEQGESVRHPNESERKPPSSKSELKPAKQQLTLSAADLNRAVGQGVLVSPQGAKIPQISPIGGSPKLSDSQREVNLNKYQPFTSSLLSGSPDFVPNIPDGEMTLLNTKADKFAVFVRRVGAQVFGLLRRNNWQRMSAQEIRRIEDFSTVEAVLSPKGEFLSVKILDSSGSVAFDGVLKSAAQGGSWDQNPPKGATADDGNIHFLFKSRVWARPGGPDGMTERRWLLLATGLL